MAKKIAPFKSSLTKKAEAREAKQRKSRKEAGEAMWKEIKQPIKLDKPFKRYWKIDKSPVDPKKRKSL